MAFHRLIRFVGEDGILAYGNLPEDVDLLSIKGLEVEVISGSVHDGFQKTSQKARVKEVCPRQQPVLTRCSCRAKIMN